MRTQMPKFIASDNLIWVQPDGSESVISINVGLPYQIDSESWACPVELDGVDGRYSDILGESSLQCLCLAIALVAKRLQDLIDHNEKLLYSKDRSLFDLQLFNVIFGMHGSTS